MLETLLLWSSIAFGDPVPIVPGDAFDVVLDAATPTRTFTWTSEFSGNLVVWASSETLDPALRATPGDGAPIDDDDSGGGTTACVLELTRPGVSWTFELRGADASTAGTVSLRFVAMTESDVTRRAATDAHEALSRVEALEKSGKALDARAEVERIATALLATPGRFTSFSVGEAAVRLGMVAYRLGDYATTRSAWEYANELSVLALPETHPQLQKTRFNLSIALNAIGDFASARALDERALATLARILPDDDLDLQKARERLATTMCVSGDAGGARPLLERVLEVRLRALPEDDPAVQIARRNLAIALKELGEFAQARVLFEQTLDVLVRALPDEHPELQRTRTNLALTLKQLGDFVGARALEETVLAVRTRVLADDDAELQRTRTNLAVTLKRLGDLDAARALQEKVLEVFATSVPDDHAELQLARGNLANTIAALGDLEGARALAEKVLEVRTRTLADDDPEIQRARGNLAAILFAQGDAPAARALAQSALDQRVKTSDPDDLDLQRARAGLAATLLATGDHAGAKALQEQVIAVLERIVTDDHPDLQIARENLTWTEADLAHAERVVALDLDCARADRAVFATLLSEHAPREAAAAARRLRTSAFRRASLAAGYGTLDPGLVADAAVLETFEADRSIRARAAVIARRAPRRSPEHDELAAAAEKTTRLALLPDRRDLYLAALREYDRIKRARVESLARDPAVATVLAFPHAIELGRALPANSRAIVFTRWRHWSSLPLPSERASSEDRVSAYVLAADGTVARVDLGTFEAVKLAADAWRRALAPELRGHTPAALDEDAAATAGNALRRLVFDPLLPALGDAKHLVVVLDEPLQAIPLDALPSGAASLGDAFQIEQRSCLSELLFAIPSPHEGTLLALGGIDYYALPDATESTTTGSRGSTWSRGFAPLRFTTAEVDALHAMFESAFADRTDATVLTKTDASRDALFARASTARFLHIATHGFFAPESIASTDDRRAADSIDAAVYSSFGDEVRGLSPMLLCGLALAGANAPADELGRVPGIVTAEELSTLDLRNCELAVLSACNTNVGVVRAGQGIASLQTALHMAGARSVITSLWRVPDEATQKLMVDFYRRIWIQKEPKWQALWNAKKTLRDAKNPDGSPAYSPADWAGWVLTGEQD